MNIDEKKNYEAALCEIVEVDAADIICTSFGGSHQGFSFGDDDDYSED